MNLKLIAETLNRAANVRLNTIDAKVMTRDGVPACSEFQRINALPRRTWSIDDGAYAVREMTRALRARRGEQTLWADQAIALVELQQYNGAIAGVRVGGGKSVLSFTAATIMSHVQRPLLIVPTKSIKSGKIKAAITEARKHWRIRDDLHWFPYELLQRKEYEEYLFKYRPGLIIMDEAHHAGRHDSIRTKMIERYKAATNVPILPMSGGLIASRVVSDSCRLCYWALGDKSPLPNPSAKSTLRFWSMALETPAKMEGGVLWRWSRQGGRDTTLLAGVGRRYVQSPGVVVSKGKSLIGTSLNLEPVIVDIRDSKILRAFDDLRAERMPDKSGDVIDPDGAVKWDMAQRLALGFFQVPDPKPPADWLDAYRTWAAYCREVISDGKLLRESEVKEACAELEPHERPYPYTDWLAIGHTFKRISKTIWLSTERVDAARAWARKHPNGIVWTQFPPFGEALADLGYYRQGALNVRTGKSILAHTKGPIVASIRTCSEDLDGLQKRITHNLFCSPPATGAWHEQAIARSHRFGCTSPEISVQYWIASAENRDALAMARLRESKVAEMTHDGERKLLIGEWFNTTIKHERGPQWTKKKTNSAVMT